MGEIGKEPYYTFYIFIQLLPDMTISILLHKNQLLASLYKECKTDKYMQYALICS